MGCRLSHFSVKFLCPTWTRLHGLNLLCPAFLTLSDRLYTFASKPNCGAHSWGVPRCHCPLEIPSICRSLLATLQLLRRFCFGLRASSSNVQQPASLRIHRQGRNTEYSAKEHPHTHTRCKAQPKSQRWCSTTQTARWYNVLSFQTNANLITLHWRYLIYDHSTSPRRNPSSLVNVLDPPRAAALVPADGTLVPQLPPYQPVFATNPVQPQKLPRVVDVVPVEESHEI